MTSISETKEQQGIDHGVTGLVCDAIGVLCSWLASDSMGHDGERDSRKVIRASTSAAVTNDCNIPAHAGMGSRNYLGCLRRLKADKGSGPFGHGLRS